LAALNHPNIAAIYSLEEFQGSRGLILELVDGPTLADRLATGPLPLDEALRVAASLGQRVGYRFSIAERAAGTEPPVRFAY
jgi:eukaryotic-like serine/threonine-protein kinase